MLIIKKLGKCLKYVLLFALCCLFYGCGGDVPPDPPKSRSELVLEILELLKNKKHEVALKKIARLREIDPTSVFLANLEISERNNMIICMAQDEINKGNLPKALEHINEGIKKYGRHKDLMVAQQKLTVAARVEDLLDIFKQPKDSKNLREAAVQLRKIGLEYKPAAPFIPIAAEKIKLAKKMDKWETKRGIDSLCSYIDMMIDRNDPDTKLLFAVLEVADPYNTTVLNYLDYLKGNESLSLKTFDDEGDIFASDENEDVEDGEVGKDMNPPVIDTENKIEENQTEEKKKGWWNKFTF